MQLERTIEQNLIIKKMKSMKATRKISLLAGFSLLAGGYGRKTSVFLRPVPHSSSMPLLVEN